MSATFEDLRILKLAEGVADEVWKRVSQWDVFAKEVVGVQLAKAADSVGANIAESFGRYNFGEKLQFLYYARGSLFETKYWLNRTRERKLMPADDIQHYAERLTDLARQLNAFSSGLRTVRYQTQTQNKSIREFSVEYSVDALNTPPDLVFTDVELEWLNS